MIKVKRFVKVIVTVCLLLSMTVLGAYASNTDWNFATNLENSSSKAGQPINYLVGYDENGNMIDESVSFAVAVALQSGDALVFAHLSAYNEAVAQYVWNSNGTEYVAEPVEALSSMNMIAFSVAGGAQDTSAMMLVSTYEGEKGALVYYGPSDDSFELYAVDVTCVELGAVGEYQVVRIDGASTSEIYYPATVLSDEGYCLGIVYDSSYMLSLATTEESFYGTADSGNGGGSGSGSGGRTNGSSTATKDNSTYIIIGVVVVLVIIVAVFSKKKKAAQSTPQPTPQPMPQPMPQAMPQPMPQQMPSTEPVIKPQAQMSHLYAIGGVMNGRLYPLTDEIHIGRDVSCAVRFPADAKGVSRIHCKLFWQNGTLMLMDMNSSYGTYVNSGKLSPMQPVPLKAGDVFYIAEKNNQFKIQ